MDKKVKDIKSDYKKIAWANFFLQDNPNVEKSFSVSVVGSLHH
jgi:hypothetical protein